MRKTLIQSISVFGFVCAASFLAVAGCSQAPQAPPKEVAIKADDKMRFDVTAFEAKPGQKISITLNERRHHAEIFDGT